MADRGGNLADLTNSGIAVAAKARGRVPGAEPPLQIDAGNRKILQRTDNKQASTLLLLNLIADSANPDPTAIFGDSS
jgi:hypothetical protein